MTPPTIPAAMTMPNIRFVVLSRTLRTRSSFTRDTIVVIRYSCPNRGGSMSPASARASAVQGRTPPGRLVLLSLLATVLGLLGGLAAFVLVRLIALLTNLALFHRIGWELP